MFYLHSSTRRKLSYSHLHSSKWKKIEFFTSSFFNAGWNKSSSSSLNWHLQIFLKTRREPLAMLHQKASAGVSRVWHEFLNSANKMETCEKEINALAYPVFATDKTEPANIVIPISEKIHRTIQSSLNDSPARCRVKLTDSFDDPPVRIRFQIEYTSRVPFSVVKSILTICFESLIRFYRWKQLLNGQMPSEMIQTKLGKQSMIMMNPQF